MNINECNSFSNICQIFEDDDKIQQLIDVVLVWCNPLENCAKCLKANKVKNLPAAPVDRNKYNLIRYDTPFVKGDYIVKGKMSLMAIMLMLERKRNGLDWKIWQDKYVDDHRNVVVTLYMTLDLPKLIPPASNNSHQ